MRSAQKDRVLTIFLMVLGSVMVIAGLASVIGGPSLQPREGVVTPDVDTEFRFYAVWYAAMGIALLFSLRRSELRSVIVPIVGVAFFIAGCARVISWIVTDRPYTGAIVLMVIELALPFVIIPWQRKVERRS